MAIAFVASFVMTVTAYAAIDVDYSIYGGRYRSSDTSVGGYISISKNSINLVVYRDDKEDCYVGGSTTDGYILSPSSKPFYALFDKVNILNTDGTGAGGSIPDYEASGSLFKKGMKNGIKSLQSDLKYIQV